jgi:hypothetical protein
MHFAKTCLSENINIVTVESDIYTNKAYEATEETTR